MQYVVDIKAKQENNLSDCNNAKGKNIICLGMERKTKNKFYKDNQGENEFRSNIAIK